VRNRRGVARRLDGVSLSLIRQVFEKAPPDAINLGLGEPTFATAPEIVDTARTVLGTEPLGYTFNGGILELRELIARRTPGNHTADSVCVTVGANGGLLGSMLASVDTGDEVLVPDPGFPTYEAITSLAGAHPVRYPMSADDGFRFSADTLATSITKKTRAVVINSPSNPTGRIIPESELKELAILADAHDLMVISDEVYHEFHYGEPCPSFFDVSNRGLVVNSLSKTEAMTGWRVGWTVGPPEFIDAITAVNQHSVTCAPTLSQRAALRALGDGAEGRAAGIRADFDRRRRLMLEIIDEQLGLPRVDPEGAFFVLLEAAPSGDSLELALDILDKTNVITIPGVAFGEEASRFLRLSFAANEACISEGLRRLAGYF
jgi:aspartate/methionine/tyrosine aminotransferase